MNFLIEKEKILPLSRGSIVCLIFIVSNLSIGNILAESVVAVIPFRLSASLLSVNVRGPNVNILLAVGYLQGLCTDIACRTGLIFFAFFSRMEGSAKRRVVRVAREERRAVFFASRFARALVYCASAPLIGLFCRLKLTYFSKKA